MFSRSPLFMLASFIRRALTRFAPRVATSTGESTIHTPLVVAILHSDKEDIDYQLYCAAYGIEMQVNSDSHAEAVLLTPHDHLYAVTKNTGVTGEDAVIVSAGVTDIPVSDDGSPNVSVITDPKNNWLLVGDPRRRDSDEVVARKLRAALDADCRVIICCPDPAHEAIAARLKGLASMDCSRVVMAFVHPDAKKPEVAVPAARAIRSYMKSIGASGKPRFIVSGCVSGKDATDILGIDGVDGVILMDDEYDDWGLILEVLRAICR